MNSKINENLDDIKKLLELDTSNYNMTKATFNITYKTKINNTNFPYNRIIFGAPGTGKSYTLNKECKELLGDDNAKNYERVTFHPDYSYAQFVGTYKPVSVSNDNFIEILRNIKNPLDLTKERFEDLCEQVSGDKDNGRRTLLLLLGLKFPDLESEKHFVTIAKHSIESESNPDTQINYAIKAAPYINKNTTDTITYEYVPGPFTRTLVKALKSCMTDNPKPYLLIVEEINRANVAVVFGDVFQLLDRDDNGVSEYAIQTSEDMRKYLAKELNVSPEECTEIQLPNNMFIWASMNSADQGVFPLDTAFKRRWDFTYLGIDDSEDGIVGKSVELGNLENQRTVEWNKLRKLINTELLSYKVNEDKLLGPYFISKKVMGNEDVIDKETFVNVFKNKVLMYLFDDAAKQKRPTLFSGCDEKSRNQYSKICKEFDFKGVFIFCESISSHFLPDIPSEDEA